MIEGVEYKIWQYANETFLFLDCSPELMNGILQKLDFFANISGLKLNFSKTKMIWIGSKKLQKKCFIIQDGSLIGKYKVGIISCKWFLKPGWNVRFELQYKISDNKSTFFNGEGEY